MRNGIEVLNDHAVSHPQLLLQVITQPESLELLVSDNGPGFPDALEPLQPLISLKEDGYGIGLEVRLLLPTVPITTPSPSLSA